MSNKARHIFARSNSRGRVTTYLNVYAMDDNDFRDIVKYWEV